MTYSWAKRLALVGTMLLAVSTACAAELRHRYEFDAADARDSAGKLDGALVGHPRFVPGRVGAKAIFLDGFQDAVSLKGMDLGDCYTITMWVKPAMDCGLLSTLLGYRADDSKDSEVLHMFLNMNKLDATDGRLMFDVRRPQRKQFTTALSPGGLVMPGVWSSVAVTMDCSKPPANAAERPWLGTVHIYVNGADVTNDTHIAGGLSPKLDLMLGRIGTAFAFRGAIDDVRFYAGVATPEEVKELAQAPKDAGTDKSDNQPVMQVPPDGQILATLRASHPRLLLTPERLQRLRDNLQKDPNLQRWFPELQKVGEKYLAAPDVKATDDSVARDILGRLFTLGLLYRLTDDVKYADRLWRDLEAAAAFPDWHPDNWLGTAELSAAFALSYDWMYDHWTPAQRATIRTALLEKGLKPGLDVYENRKLYGWYRVTFNWNQVCNGGVGLGALALADEEPQLAGKLVRYTLLSLPRAVVQFAPDGAGPESPGYWGYANQYTVMYLSALNDALGTDFGLSKIDGFDKIGDFPQNVTSPTGLSFNYGDANPDYMRAPEMFWLASRFKKPDWARFEASLVQPQSWPYDPLGLDMVWYDPASMTPAGQPWPLDRYFRYTELALFRSSWDDPKGLFLAAKAGDNKANHCHLCCGSFVLDASGERWAMDMGAEKYSAPGYFDTNAGRWVYYRTRAEGHNTLVINPDKEPDQDPKAEALIDRFSSTPQRSFAITDLTPVYARQADRVVRGFAMLNRQQALIQDEIRCKAPGRVWWFMHTQAQVNVSDDGTTAILERRGKRLMAQLLSPAGASFSVMAAEPLGTSPLPKQTFNEGVRKLAIRLTGQSDCRLVVVLTPLANDAAAPATPKIVPLADW
jgi:hypothetical protein